MSIPSFLTNCKRTAMAVIVMIFALSGITLQAQKAGRTLAFAPEAQPPNIDQCANGAPPAAPIPCAGGAWVNGNIHGTNSQWVENQYVPYRVVILGMSANQNAVGGIEWDTSEGNKHALDFIGTYNATNPADPCNVVVNGCGTVSTFPIPADPRVTALRNGGAQPLGNLTIWGGVINSVGSDALGSNGQYIYTGPSDYTATSTAGLNINFTADSNGGTVVIAWSGHISSRLDWGLLNTAIGIQGSSYHMRLTDFSGFGGGQQDRSMSVAGVIFPGLFSVRKWAIQRDGTLTFNEPFGFNATTGNFLSATDVPVTSFNITDSNADPNFALYPSPNDSFAGKILDFVNPVTVNEALKAGWSTTDVDCEEFDGGLGLGRATFSGITIGTSSPFTPASATATLQEGAVVRCTFTNQQAAAPTAAPVSVGGRVLNSFGRGISGVTVQLTDLATGETMTALTNSFGYYRFNVVDTEAFYSLTVSSKRYRFPNSTQMFTLNQDMFDMNFISSN